MNVTAAPLAAWVDRIEDFLVREVGRLEAVLLDMAQEPRSNPPRTQVPQDLELVRADSERERQRQIAALQQDSARLMEAWSQVEAEQRRLLAERQSLQLGIPPTLRSQGNTNTTMDGLNTTRSNQHVERHGEVPVNWPDTAGDPASLSPQRLQEFQQLKREIQRHGHLPR